MSWESAGVWLGLENGDSLFGLSRQRTLLFDTMDDSMTQ